MRVEIYEKDVFIFWYITLKCGNILKVSIFLQFIFSQAMTSEPFPLQRQMQTPSNQMQTQPNETLSLPNQMDTVKMHLC